MSEQAKEFTLKIIYPLFFCVFLFHSRYLAFGITICDLLQFLPSIDPCDNLCDLIIFLFHPSWTDFSLNSRQLQIPLVFVYGHFKNAEDARADHTTILGITRLGTASAYRYCQFLDMQLSESLQFYAPSNSVCPFWIANAPQLKLLRALPGKKEVSAEESQYQLRYLWVRHP